MLGRRDQRGHRMFGQEDDRVDEPVAVEVELGLPVVVEGVALAQGGPGLDHEGVDQPEREPDGAGRRDPPGEGALRGGRPVGALLH